MSILLLILPGWLIWSIACRRTGEMLRASRVGALGTACIVVGLWALLAGCGLLPTTTARAAFAPDAELPAAETAPAPAEADRNVPAPGRDAPRAESESAGELSTAPLSPTVVIPPGRPAWVEAPAELDGPRPRMPVSSGPHPRRRECDKALDAEIEDAVHDFVNEHLGSSSASTLVHFSLKEIKQRLLKPENYYYETIQVSIGPMHQGHALLEFNDEFLAEINARWERIAAIRRLLQAGLVFVGALSFVGVLFGYLRLDTATKGHYTRRLQFMTAMAILAIAALLVVRVTRGAGFADLLVYFL